MRAKPAMPSSTRRTAAEFDELFARCGAALCLASIIAGAVWLTF